MAFVHRQMMMGQNPRVLLKQIVPDLDSIPDEVDDFQLWRAIVNLLSEPPKRPKLNHINTLDDVIYLLKTCSKIIVLTGAGVGKIYQNIFISVTNNPNNSYDIMDLV